MPSSSHKSFTDFSDLNRVSCEPSSPVDGNQREVCDRARAREEDREAGDVARHPEYRLLGAVHVQDGGRQVQCGHLSEEGVEMVRRNLSKVHLLIWSTVGGFVWVLLDKNHSESEIFDNRKNRAKLYCV